MLIPNEIARLISIAAQGDRPRITTMSAERLTDERSSVAKRTVYQRVDCKWAWRLTADNGTVIAVDGSQGYENEADARKMADRITGGEFSGAEKFRAPNAACAEPNLSVK